MRTIKLFILLIVAVSVQSCYITKQSIGQIDLNWNQTPLAEAILTEKNLNRKKLLSEIPKIKAWGEANLALQPTTNYQGYYATEKKGITFVVVAAEPDQLTRYTWWFPIIGTVPYKGYFDLEDAKALQQDLQQEGYDTWIFAAPAYSTLGWFQDPITTPMLRSGLVDLTETLLHEMAHATLYIEGNSTFNEQLASFVGTEGAKEYLSQNAEGNLLLEKQTKHNKTYQAYRAFLQKQLTHLKAQYAETKNKEKRLQIKANQMQALSQKYLEFYPTSTVAQAHFNHARLLLFEMYQETNPLFPKLLRQAGGNWPAFWKLAEAAGKKQPAP